jgi:hypothetical protein
MRALIVSLFVTFLFVSTGFAQEQEQTPKPRKPWKDRMIYGGNVIFNVNTGFTWLGATPMIGYRVTDKYTAGVGMSYIYGSGNRVTSNNYAASIWQRYALLEQVFLHAELEYGSQSITQELITGDITSTRSYPAFLVGGGYRQVLSGNASIGFSVLYDVIQDPNSPYRDLVYRGGIAVGF